MSPAGPASSAAGSWTGCSRRAARSRSPAARPRPTSRPAASGSYARPSRIPGRSARRARGPRRCSMSPRRSGSGAGTADYHRANVLGTRAVIEGCRAHGVRRLVHTSTPSVVYNGRDLSGADESLPLTHRCPSPYPLTKAEAEAEVLAAHSAGLGTVALRPHLIWGTGDPHLVPRILASARTGRLRIVGEAGTASTWSTSRTPRRAPRGRGGLSPPAPPAGGRAYFITNGEPVVLWDWINGLLAALGSRAVTRRISLANRALRRRGLRGRLAPAAAAGRTADDPLRGHRARRRTTGSTSPPRGATWATPRGWEWPRGWPSSSRRAPGRPA